MAGPYDDPMDDDDETPSEDTDAELPELTINGTQDGPPNVEAQKLALEKARTGFKDPETEDYIKRAQSAAQAKRDALVAARQHVLSRRYNDGMAWLAFSAGMGAPTKSGSFFESLSNANQQLIPQLQKRQDWQEGQQDDADKLTSQIAGYGPEGGDPYDPTVLSARLKLAQINANLQGKSLQIAAKGPATGSQPELVKLQSALEALPKGDPRRAPIEARIRKLNYIAPHTDPNAEYQLSDDDRKMMDAVGNLQQGLQMALSRAGGNTQKRSALANYLYTTYPNYSETDFKQLNDTVGAYSKLGTNSPGAQIISYNTVINHLDSLRQLSKDLQNGKIRGANAVRNWLKTNTGDADVTNLQAGLRLVSGELAKAIAGSQTGVDERTALERIADAANSPEQFAGLLGDEKMGKVITGVLPQLLAGKMSELKRGFDSRIPEAAKGRYKDWFNKKLSPATIRTLRDMKSEGFEDDLPAATGAGGGGTLSSDAQSYLKGAGGR